MKPKKEVSYSAKLWVRLRHNFLGKSSLDDTILTFDYRFRFSLGYTRYSKSLIVFACQFDSFVCGVSAYKLYLR